MAFDAQARAARRRPTWRAAAPRHRSHADSAHLAGTSALAHFGHPRLATLADPLAVST